MNEITYQLGKPRSHRRRSSFRSSLRFPAVPAPPIDWPSIVLESLPQEPPKNLIDVVWNGYKKEFWGKFKPDSLIAFEVLRIAAREPDTPEGIRFLANVLAAFCAIDGYGATIEGLRKEERARMSARELTPIPPLFPVWPS
jgi:hypothetical protein